MGLKCSVIGHKYGEASVEREREEQGSEVVITIREQETCERCGTTRIVSENKEVTAIETPSDIAGEMVDDEADEAVAAEGEEAPTEPSAESESTDTEAVDAGANDAEIIGDAESSGPSGADSELDDPPTVDPMTDAEEADAADPETDDAVIIDADDESGADDDREPGEWPAEPDSGEDGWTPITETADEEEASDDGSDVEPLGGSAVTVPEGKFRCPECEFTTDVESSSLRAGDFCPECARGALVTTE